MLHHCGIYIEHTYQILTIISKKHFRLARMAPSEWTRTVWAVRDTLGGWLLHARPSLPCVASHIALWTLFGHFFSLCRSSNLNKHSGIVANCDDTSDCVHWVHTCIRIAMQCYAARIPAPVPSTLSSRSVARWEDMILPGCEDPCNWVDPRNIRKSEWIQKLGMIESVFSLYDLMR